MLAKQQLRSPARASTGDEEASSPAALARTSWQKCLHDTHSSLYYNSASDTLAVILLKCEALQALEQFQEAVDEVSMDIILQPIHLWQTNIMIFVVTEFF
jgi:hypothetical protein